VGIFSENNPFFRGMPTLASYERVSFAVPFSDRSLSQHLFLKLSSSTGMKECLYFKSLPWTACAPWAEELELAVWDGGLTAVNSQGKTRGELPRGSCRARAGSADVLHQAQPARRKESWSPTAISSATPLDIISYMGLKPRGQSHGSVCRFIIASDFHCCTPI